MKYVIPAIAMIALLGFVGLIHAADAPKPKVTKGHFLKVDGMEVTYKGGVKGTGKEHAIQIDDSTKVTLDGKEAKITDLKEGIYIEITGSKELATVIAASTVTPTPTTKPTTKPTTPPTPAAK